MLEIRFQSGRKDKLEALRDCFLQASNKNNGVEMGLCEENGTWELSLGSQGYAHDAAAVIDIDVPGALALYTELTGKPSADALTAGLTVRNVNDIQ